MAQLNGIALLAGTAIGAAILALPSATAHLGLVQVIVLYVLCWYFMTQGAFYLLEANLFLGPGANLLSIAKATLGPLGKLFTIATYIILLYALIAAYLTGLGEWLSPWVGFASLIPAAIICLLLWLPRLATYWLNRIFMIVLLVTFISLVLLKLPTLQQPILFSHHPYFDLQPLPLLITAFGSAIVVPTLCEYFAGDALTLKRVIKWGSLIPLGVYLIWNGVMRNTPLFPNEWLVRSFSFFALITSLLGTSLSLFDFLADSLKIKKNRISSLYLYLLLFLPPFIWIHFYPQGFKVILSFAGIFAALLLGILPVLFVWAGRFYHHFNSPWQVGGGKFKLVLTFGFFIIVIGIELCKMPIWHSLF